MDRIIASLNDAKQIADETAGMLTIHYHPSTGEWAVSCSLYHARSMALDTAINAMKAQRAHFTLNEPSVEKR